MYRLTFYKSYNKPFHFAKSSKNEIRYVKFIFTAASIPQTQFTSNFQKINWLRLHAWKFQFYRSQEVDACTKDGHKIYLLDKKKVRKGIFFCGWANFHHVSCIKLHLMIRAINKQLSCMRFFCLQNTQKNF